MGKLCNESFEEFLESIKRAGITVHNEAELRERLAESQRWRYAFTTLAANGAPLGIRFEKTGFAADADQIHRTFSDFQFPERAEAVFNASLQAAH